MLPVGHIKRKLGLEEAGKEKEEDEEEEEERNEEEKVEGRSRGIGGLHG